MPGPGNKTKPSKKKVTASDTAAVTVSIDSMTTTPSIRSTTTVPSATTPAASSASRNTAATESAKTAIHNTTYTDDKVQSLIDSAHTSFEDGEKALMKGEVKDTRLGFRMVRIDQKMMFSSS